MNSYKYFIKTFGCQMNEYDSQRISYVLEQEGYKRTSDKTVSDVIIINTCAVREKANNRFFSYLGNLKSLKKDNEGPIICVCGCTVQQMKREILKKFPYIDIAIGPRSIHKLAGFLRKRLQDKKCFSDFDLKGFDSEILKNKDIDIFKQYIPIIVGCNNFCSYCIVPYARGREISIPSDEIIKKCESLVLKGALDITLLGQNVNSYGKDLKDDISFARLLEKIANIKTLKRLRFMTSHPKDFSDTLIDVIAANKNIANHIHLPLQSGSDRVLRLMRRGYDSNRYMDIVQKIKKCIPDCSITTDIIVGFPGERYSDFKKTLELVKEVSYSRAFTFIYSKREGTAAETFQDPVDIDTKKKWFNELLEVQKSISIYQNSLYKNKKFEVLVEGLSAKSDNVLEGRMENNMLVNFRGDREMIGSFKYVLIKDYTPFYLKGELTC